MEIKETKAEGLKYQFNCHVSPEDLEKKIETRLGSLSQEVQIKGFRPGKVPLSIVRQRFGPSVRGEIIEKMVSEASQKVLTDRNLRPAQKPRVDFDEDYEDGKPLSFNIDVEVLPEINAFDASTFEVEKLTVALGQSRLDETLKNLVERSPLTVELPEGEKADLSHVVTIDYVCTLDGKALRERDNFPVTVDGDFSKNQFGGKFVGAKAGDEIVSEYTFPEDFQNKDLAGQKTQFKATVKSVGSYIPLEDKKLIAEKVGYESPEKMEEDLKKSLENENAEKAFLISKRLVLDKLAAIYDFPVPQSMADAEFNAIVRSTAQESIEAAEGGEKKEETLSDQDKEKYKLLAERRVRLGLLLADISRKEKLSVTEQELRTAILEEAYGYSNPKQIFEFYEKNPQALEYVKAPILENKVIRHILEQSKGETKTITEDELKERLDALEKDEA